MVRVSEDEAGKDLDASQLLLNKEKSRLFIPDRQGGRNGNKEKGNTLSQ